MRAVVYERYGPPDVMELTTVDRPAVGDNGVLVKVAATSINRSDWETLIGSPFYVRINGLRAPRTKVLGSDVAGVVAEVGASVAEFQPGDEVFGDVIYHGMGTFAEYVLVEESAPIVTKPADLSFEQAATLPQSAVLAVQGLRTHGEVTSGQRVLINGAGGGGGTFAIQLAKSFGAEVTGVDSAEKAATMREAGADYVIDYETENYTKSGETYDRIIDFVGSRSVFANRRVLNEGGVYLIVGGKLRRILQAALLGWLVSRLSGRRLGLLTARPNKEDLTLVASLVENGTLRPMIDRVYPLDEVPDAMQRLGEGHALGKLVIRV